jgi:RimJ/RimL family protein N-acetyltransferase
MTRIYLQALESRDMETCRGWRNDHRIWRWCRQNTFISDLQQKAWFDRQDQDPTIAMFRVVLETEEDGDGGKKVRRPFMVGVAGFTSIDLLNSRAEFSLYISPDMHGKGIGKVALKTLLIHGFQNYGFQTIWGETYDGNPAARLFESIGFVKEGTRRQHYMRDGQFIDAHLYSITRDEWLRTLSVQGSDSSSSPQPQSVGGSDGSPEQPRPKPGLILHQS